MIYNTKQHGIVRTLILYVEKKYKAICLDFDIIEEAKKKEDAEKQIKEAIAGYIANIQKNNLSDDLLNRHADKKYWDIYYAYLKFLKNEKILEVDKKVKNPEIFTSSIEEILKKDSDCSV